MSPSDPDHRVLEMFHAALAIPEREREDWLREHTEGEGALRSEVGALIEAHQRTAGILDAPPFWTDGAIPREADIEGVLREGLADRYEIREELGRGGMALVFLAHERKHDRSVVIKALKPGLASLYGEERFEREVQLAAQLSHPHILGLIDSGSEGGILYYVMPRVAGETLRDRLEREETLSLNEAGPLLVDIASALAYAHARGVVHRDLKPGNVLCAGSHAYLLDFGIAKTLYEEEGDQLTGIGDALGTPRYMAPEQASGDPEVDHRADIYAWGLLAYEMLTGEPGRRRGVAVHPEEVRTRLPQGRPELSAELVNLVARCLEPEPSDRVSDADEILIPFQTGVGRGRARRGRGSPKPAWQRAWVGLAAIAAIVVGATFVVTRRAEAPTTLGPIAVAPFVNETGDAALDPLGNLAGDWIAQGLQQLGVLPVLPWPTVLEMARAADEEGGATDLVSYLAREAGAGTVVTGSFYELGDQIQFGAVVTDAVTGEILTAPTPISVPKNSPQSAIRELRDRIMGSLAIAADPQVSGVPLSAEPPTFEAYRSFDRGLRLYLDQDYRPAALEFAEAYRQDTTFIVTLLYQATLLVNVSEHGRADSILSFLAPRRERLGEYQDNRWEFLRALLDGEGERMLRLARRGLELGPGSRAAYNYANTAVGLNRPAEALLVLEPVDPDRGSMRGWAQYWTQLSHATHLLGLFDRDLDAATRMRDRYPERRAATVLQARALAAQGDETGLATLLEGIAALSPRTYWSYGAALVVAGEELSVHGRPEAAPQYLERALVWLDARLDVEPEDRSNRYWLGTAYYDLGRWAESRSVFETLVRDFPERRDYRGLAALAIAQTGELDSAVAILGNPPRYDPGDYLAYQARLEAVIGDPDRAVDYFSEALEQGVGGFSWLHASAFGDLWTLEDYPRFRQLLARATETR